MEVGVCFNNILSSSRVPNVHGKPSMIHLVAVILVMSPESTVAQFEVMTMCRRVGDSTPSTVSAKNDSGDVIDEGFTCAK